MIRSFAVALPILTLLAGCEQDAGRTGGPTPPVRPYRSGTMPIGHWGVGPIRADTYFEQPVIQALFPKAQVRDGLFQIDMDESLITITVVQDGVQVLEIDDSNVFAPNKDDPLVGKVRLLGGPVRGPRGETIGMSWRDAGFDLSQCELGEGRAVDTLDCARRNEGAVTYVFAIKGWGSHVDIPSKSTLNANAYLREIVWTPPSNLRPKAPATAPAKP
jgi:hypothetical protein